jgi:hypothetical protein
MLFDIEEDAGARITGYFVPDAFSNHGVLRISSSGRELALIEATEVRPSVVAAGRHESGRCGFTLTDENVPSLSESSCLAIADADTGIVIYRRKPAALPLKLFRLETSTSRLPNLDTAVAEYFRLSFLGIDQRGRETTTQTFLLRCTDSLFVSARLMYKAYELSIDSSFRKICVVQDPHVELAETILTAVGRLQVMEHSLRDQLALNDVAVYFSDIDVSDAHALRRALSRMPEPVANTLANPLTRMLAARTADELDHRNLVPTSLEVLASFDIVGVRDRPATVIEPLAELLGIDSSLLQFPSASDMALELAQVLRSQGLVTELLELDLEVVDAVQRAVDTGFESLD